MGAPLSQAGPPPHRQALQCPPGCGKYRVAGRATFLQGLLTGLGNLVGAGEDPRFHRSAPLPHCSPFLEMGELGLLRVCCSWGHFNRCCPRPHCRGHGGPHGAPPPAGERAEPSRVGGPQFRLETLATEQASPLSLPQTILLFIHSDVHGARYSWTPNIRRLPIADRI